MYSNHYKIIKSVSFEPFHYAINMNFISSSKVFREIDYIFLSNVLLVLINKIMTFQIKN